MFAAAGNRASQTRQLQTTHGGRFSGPTTGRIAKKRTTKGTYTGEVYRGLRLKRDQLVELFTRDCHLADLKIIEPLRILQEIGWLDMALEGNLAVLFRTVAAEMWLRNRSGDAG